MSRISILLCMFLLASCGGGGGGGSGGSDIPEPPEVQEIPQPGEEEAAVPETPEPTEEEASVEETVPSSVEDEEGLVFYTPEPEFVPEIESSDPTTWGTQPSPVASGVPAQYVENPLNTEFAHNENPDGEFTFDNPDAIDPLLAMRAVKFPKDTQFQYQKSLQNSMALDLNIDRARGARAPEDLEATTHRAFKLWGRRIVSVLPNAHSHAHGDESNDLLMSVDLFVGHEQPCNHAIACAGHDIGKLYLMPRFLEDEAYITDNKINLNGFAILLHEFGHIFDFHAGNQAVPNEPYHLDCYTHPQETTMCDGSREIYSPTEVDFDGIRHHYELRDHSDYEVFGIWASVPVDNSDLKGFGVRITRTLIAPTPDIENLDDFDNIEDHIQDYVQIETGIMGIPYNGPINTGTGTATWNGDLIAVHRQNFDPVLGDAFITMDLATADMLTVQFTNILRTDPQGNIYSIPDFSRLLVRRFEGDSTWVDAPVITSARFYSVGDDPIGAVAGRINWIQGNFVGVYGALRND